VASWYELGPDLVDRADLVDVVCFDRCTILLVRGSQSSEIFGWAGSSLSDGVAEALVAKIIMDKARHTSSVYRFVLTYPPSQRQ